MPTIGV